MGSLVERWTTLGFTEYEAKAYVALLQLGTATGYQIAKASGVPRSMIYQSLDKLAARGAVLTQSSAELVRYAPVPPDELLRRAKERLAAAESEVSRAEDKLSQEEATLAVAEAEGRVEYLRARQDVNGKLEGVQKRSLRCAQARFEQARMTVARISSG